jgi:MGT family glycosyltransferase
LKIILASTPAVGHLGPMLLVAKLLCDAGHDVVVTTASSFRERAQATGARFVPFTGLADMDLAHIDKTFPERKLLEPGAQQLLFDQKHVFINPIPDQFAVLEEIMSEFAADVLLVDSFFFGCLPYLTQTGGNRPAVAVLAITVMTYHRDDGAPILAGLPLAENEEQVARYAEFNKEINEELFNPAQQLVNNVLERLGFEPLSIPVLDAMVSLPDVYLQPTIVSLEYPRADMPSNVRFIGALPVSSGVSEPNGLHEMLATGKRVVLVTQGTVANHDLSQLLAPTLQAFAADDDVVVLATTGGRETESIPCDIPANSLVSKFLPYDTLMPYIDVLVTNGGYGTVMFALAHGVPVVVAGSTEDKPEVGARVEWSGVGINLRTDSPKPEEVRGAVLKIFEDSKYRNRAQEVAFEFHGHNALDSLYAELLKICQCGARS